MAQKTIYELDLVKIAQWHKRCTILAILVFFIWIGLILLSANSIAVPGLVSFIVWLFYLVSLIASIVFVVILNRVCGSSAFEMVAYGIVTVFLSFIVLLASISRAGTILRLAGVKPGFAGISRDEIDKVRPGHCRGCGYDREGLGLLQECPECTRVPQVI